MRLISYSLWGADDKYCVGALENARAALEIYPGWRCRFYLGTSVPAAVRDELDAHDHVDLVDVGVPGDWRGVFWRFDAIDDAEVVIIRDTDSLLGQREREAVDAWIDSGYGVHLMRDHPMHGQPLLAGMWGVRRGALPGLDVALSAFDARDAYGTDYDFGRSHVLPRARGDLLVHDEFFGGHRALVALQGCEAQPFPRPRMGLEFVGAVRGADGATDPQHDEALEAALSAPTSSLVADLVEQTRIAFASGAVHKGHRVAEALRTAAPQRPAGYLPAANAALRWCDHEKAHLLATQLLAEDPCNEMAQSIMDRSDALSLLDGEQLPAWDRLIDRGLSGATTDGQAVRCQLVDQSLVDAGGHPLTVDQVIVDGLRAGSLSHELHANVRYEGGLDSEVRRTFTSMSRANKSIGSLTTHLEELDEALATPADVRLFPTANALEVRALLEIGARDRRLSNFICILIESDPTLLEFAAAGIVAAAERASQAGCACTVLVETDAMAQLLGGYESGGLDLEVIAPLAPACEPLGSSERSEVRIGFGGYVGPTKGAAVFAEAADRVLEVDANTVLDVSMQYPAAAEERVASLIDLMGRHSERASMHVGQRSAADYRSWISSLDLLVLPYDPNAYRYAGSLMCREAELLGLPMVVPARAAFSRRVLNAGIAVAASEHTGQSYADAILRATGEIAMLQAAARRHAETRTSSIDRLVKRCQQR